MPPVTDLRLDGKGEAFRLANPVFALSLNRLRPK